jgi:Gnt-I system high-affinity gluconate transporter
MPLLIILLGIALQIFLTVKKVSPFLSLLVVAILIGFLLGMQPADVLTSIEKGVGSTLGGLALIICLGAILGKILESSGAAEQISTTLIKGFGEKNIQWAMLLTGFLVGLPLYYNAGFIILVPLVFSVAKRTRLPLLLIAIPMAASLSTTHCFLPPHPGPVVLVNAFKADLGKTLIYGLILVIPIVIMAGPFLGRLLQKIAATPPVATNGHDLHVRELKLPVPFASFIIALLPVLLITLSVFAKYFITEETVLKKIILFIGDSTIALLLSVFCALFFLGLQMGRKMPVLIQWLNDALSGIAVIMLIITAGGVLKQVLTDSGTGAYITSFSSAWQVPPLIFGWVVTALLRVAIGSATVAGLTAAGIVSPVVAAGTVSPELMVLAVGSGSVFGSHVNDSGFWMFKEFFNITLKQTFLSWTIMETTISILGLIGVLILNMFI